MIAQCTGFEKVLPTGEGLFAFRTMDDVLAAVDRIESDYERAGKAARAVAEDHLEATKRLPALPGGHRALKFVIFNADDFGYTRRGQPRDRGGPPGRGRDLDQPHRERSRHRGGGAAGRRAARPFGGPARELHERGPAARGARRSGGVLGTSCAASSTGSASCSDASPPTSTRISTSIAALPAGPPSRSWPRSTGCRCGTTRRSSSRAASTASGSTGSPTRRRSAARPSRASCATS